MAKSSEKVDKLTIVQACSYFDWPWQGEMIVPPAIFRQISPCSTFHPFVRNLIGECTMSRLTAKIILERYSKPQKYVSHFE